MRIEPKESFSKRISASVDIIRVPLGSWPGEVAGRAYGGRPSSIQSLKSPRRSGGQGSSHGMLAFLLFKLRGLNFYPGGTSTHCSCHPSLDAHLWFLILHATTSPVSGLATNWTECRGRFVPVTVRME